MGAKILQNPVGNLLNQNNQVVYENFDRLEDNMNNKDIVQITVDRNEDQDFGVDGIEPLNGDNRAEDLPDSVEDRLADSMTCDQTVGLSEKDILSNPYLEKLLPKIVDNKVNKKLEQEEGKTQTQDRRFIQDKQRDQDGAACKSILLKSPSDTTLYAPALKHNVNRNSQIQSINDHDNTDLVRDYVRTSNMVTGADLNQQTPQLTIRITQRDHHDHNEDIHREAVESGEMQSNSPIRRIDNGSVQNNMIDKISDFIEGIRIDATHAQEEGPSTSNGRRNRYEEEKEKLSQARTRANRLILEAEQYKAKIEVPKGRSLDDKEMDDDFFHLSCHIEPGLRTKIENGEFIELEKLLPRNNIDGDSEDRMELVNKDGQIFFVPASSRDNKIRNVRRWEQAFRVYAAIYSAANPHRAHEIWQYVYVINSAASCYVWEEVAQYDFMFRQLMARNPGRSWAVTYTQMWQMTLRHVVNKGTGCGMSSGSSNGGGNSQNHRQ